MADLIVVNSKVKELISQSGNNTSGDYSEKLSSKVEEIVKASIERANANGRKTVMSKDL